MSNEFDDLIEPVSSTASGRTRPEGAGDERLVGRLVSRLYARSDASLKARLLACLLKPLGSLSLVGVASGAFAGFLDHSAGRAVSVTFDQVGRFSNEQIYELGRFVEQLSPEAVQQFASMALSGPLGAAAFSAAAALALVRASRRDAHDVLPREPSHGGSP